MTVNNLYQNTLSIAKENYKRGWQSIPIKIKEKNPNRKGWQKFKTTEDELAIYFNGKPQNIGVLLGKPSKNLVDVDLDIIEARRVAPFFLPPTLTFGRTGNPVSHYLYVCEIPTKQFKDPLKVSSKETAIRDEATLVEIRSTGLQTVFPGSIHPSGEPIEWTNSEFGEPTKINAVDLGKAVAMVASAALMATYWRDGIRNDLVLALSGGLIHHGFDEKAVLNFVEAVCVAANDEETNDRINSTRSTIEKFRAGGKITGFKTLIELTDKKVVDAIGKWLEIETKQTKTDNKTKTNEQDFEVDDEKTHFTDIGNAARLAARHGDDLHYCHQLESWFVWNKKLWQPDALGATAQRAKETVRHFLIEASKIQSESKREKHLKYGLDSGKSPRIDAMIKLARSDERIAITPASFDTNPLQLNVQNCTLDLRTGEPHQHRREDLITKLAQVEYDPDAHSDKWENFLAEATSNDSELMQFLQRAVGYSLTGDTSEEALFFLHGDTATGKSTFLEAVKAMLGSYAMTSDFEAFLVRRQAGGARNDIARLTTARFVAASEVAEGQKFDENLIKQLTGRDTVTARFLYQESYEFQPKFKLWLSANHAPEIKPGDNAIWRRIRRIPFENSVPLHLQNKTLKDYLCSDKTARSAILNWAIQGCLGWQRYGLGTSKAVDDATREYRDAENALKEFFDSQCALQPELWTLTQDLRTAYEKWASAKGNLLNENSFTKNLRLAGLIPKKFNGQRGWQGIGLLKTVFDEVDGKERETIA